MMRYLREVSKDRQVFITTHSTNFLDTTQMKNIYLVSKDATTMAQQLDQREVEERVPTELGIRLSSLFIYDRLVFVESQTDEDIMRAWASTCGVNFDQANVGFIHMFGARNLSYFAAEGTLAFLAKRQVKMWFMIDRDERDEGDIEVIQGRLGRNAEASVLERREIENYLVHPRVLAMQIAKKLVVGGGVGEDQPEAEDLVPLIQESAEKLRNFAIFKRMAKTMLQPLYPRRVEPSSLVEGNGPEQIVGDEINVWESRVSELKDSITEEARRQSQEVAEKWEERKLDIVPGDLLIDMVYRNYGVRFRKDRRDGVELAKMMIKDEIGSELVGLLRRIVT